MQQHKRPNRIILGLLALGVLAGAALTASPAQAASGVGPFFPEPAWDRKLPAATRFLVLTDWNNEAVLDKETGLVWERTPDSLPQYWVFSKVYLPQQDREQPERLAAALDCRADQSDPSVRDHRAEPATGPSLCGHPVDHLLVGDDGR